MTLASILGAITLATVACIIAIDYIIGKNKEDKDKHEDE